MANHLEIALEDCEISDVEPSHRGVQSNVRLSYVGAERDKGYGQIGISAALDDRERRRAGYTFES